MEYRGDPDRPPVWANRRLDYVKWESMNNGTWNDWRWRTLEFLEFVNTSSRHTVLTDVAQLGRPFFRVEPGFAAVHLAHAGQNDYLPVFLSLRFLFLRGNKLPEPFFSLGGAFLNKVKITGNWLLRGHWIWWWPCATLRTFCGRSVSFDHAAYL